MVARLAHNQEVGSSSLPTATSAQTCRIYPLYNGTGRRQQSALLCCRVIVMFTTAQIRQLIADDRLDQFYNDKSWRRLSHKLIKDYHKECQMCKAEHKLTRATLAHHIKHLRDYPELAYEPSNLMPLCHDCHERIHERGAYAGGRQKYTNEEKW